MDFLEKYPDIKKRLDTLYKNRRNEILSQMLKIDDKYIKLNSKRTNASMALRETLDDTGVELFEKYSDSIYAQEVYELDFLYKQAISDTLNLLTESGLI